MWEKSPASRNKVIEYRHMQLFDLASEFCGGSRCRAFTPPSRELMQSSELGVTFIKHLMHTYIYIYMGTPLYGVRGPLGFFTPGPKPLISSMLV